MVDRLDLPLRYWKQIEVLLSKHVPDAEVWAYGSRVSGKSHDGSDLDLVLRGPSLEPLDDGFYDLLEAIEGSNIPILVQAHDWAMLPESFHKEIERDYIVVQEGTRANAAGLPDGWLVVTIGEIAEKVAMGPFGSSIKVETFVPEGVPIVSGQHLHGFRVDDAPGFNFITEEHAQRLANANVKRGDIVFTHAGNIGQVAYIPESSEFERYVISQRQFYMRCDHSKALPEFVTLYFRSPEGQHKLLANASQVGVPSIAQPVTYLRTIEIPLPPLSEQRAIAHVLGTLDDKIELNRRMNETLEAMPRALFKAWFVDFEPVRAKMEGRWHRGESLPGLPAEYYDLFPDRLVNSELGEIPEGWEVKELRYCIDVERGLSYKGSGLSSTGVPMHNLNSVYEGGGYKDDGIKYYEGDFQERHITQSGDVLVANTEQGHDRLLIGFAAVVPKRFGDRGLFSHHLYRIRPKGGASLSANFVCQLLNTQSMHDTVSGYATGTTVNMLPVDALKTPPIVIPPVQLVTTYNDIAEAARVRQEQFIEESRSLVAQRDAWLPKLVPGDVRLAIG